MSAKRRIFLDTNILLDVLLNWTGQAAKPCATLAAWHPKSIPATSTAW